jgi:hypothetical protein
MKERTKKKHIRGTPIDDGFRVRENCEDLRLYMKLFQSSFGKMTAMTVVSYFLFRIRLCVFKKTAFILTK